MEELNEDEIYIINTLDENYYATWEKEKNVENFTES